MKLRMVEKDDYPKVAEIYKKHWLSQNLEIPETQGRIIEALVENDEGRIITYGMVKLWAEAMMIMDSSRPTKERIEGLRLLIQTAIMASRKVGFNEFHLFTGNEAFAKVLVKHFGFQDLPGLHVLRLKLPE